MAFKSLKCPNCRGRIDTIDETTKQAFCPYCDALIVDVQERQAEFVRIEGQVRVAGVEGKEEMISRAQGFVALGESKRAQKLLEDFVDKYPLNFDGWQQLYLLKKADHESRRDLSKDDRDCMLRCAKNCTTLAKEPDELEFVRTKRMASEEKVKLLSKRLSEAQERFEESSKELGEAWARRERAASVRDMAFDERTRAKHEFSQANMRHKDAKQSAGTWGCLSAPLVMIGGGILGAIVAFCGAPGDWLSSGQTWAVFCLVIFLVALFGRLAVLGGKRKDTRRILTQAEKTLESAEEERENSIAALEASKAAEGQQQTRIAKAEADLSFAESLARGFGCGEDQIGRLSKGHRAGYSIVLENDKRGWFPPSTSDAIASVLGLSLDEAKSLMGKTPVVIAENVPWARAEEILAALKPYGAHAVLQ